MATAQEQWDAALDYLYNCLPAFERQGAGGYKPGLETARKLAAMYGNPQATYPVIHIAGTNGKGSVAHLLAAVLQLCGYNVGLYTSPHIVDFRERIRFNGKKVPRAYVMRWVNSFRRKKVDFEPSFFELTSTMAFDYFAYRRADVVVVETGLGGRLDSTNIVQPLLSIITNISLEHTQFLGNTLEQVAGEKAGIIKHGAPALIGEAADPSVRAVFEHRAADVYVPITFAQDDPEVLSYEIKGNYNVYTTRSFGRINGELTGDYQALNANTVFKALLLLRGLGFVVDERAVRRGFRMVRSLTGLMGRWMKLSDSPLTICDCAHNAGAFTLVAKQLAAISYEHIHLVMGFMADKDLSRILPLLPKDGTYYFTQAHTSRALPANMLQAQAARYGLTGDAYDDVHQALAAARKAATRKDLIYVGGSMYLLAEVLEKLASKKI